MNREDETGMVNIVVSVATWQAKATIARAVIVHGRVQCTGQVTNLNADRFDELPLASTTRSRHVSAAAETCRLTLRC